MLTIDSNKIYNFWFDNCVENAASLNRVAKRWYSGGPSFDAEIRQVFGPLFETLPVSAKVLNVESNVSVNELLAAILVFDQFSRNCFRSSARAFEYDPLALSLLDIVLARSLDMPIAPIVCTFVYMPLQHAEDMARQEQGVELFDALACRAEPPYKDYIEGTAAYAREHRQIIEAFGRFPHRNVALGRESTAEELAYLASGGKRFGQ
ncbi:DUF924 family protein [Teredinibacter purpureus]|uniref:DUF924 family protein n=1 Tax=Teredinibacter purpureus TaxID=2731756 RepID=UPI0005F81D90|nr:DUF924 family protein [Teredinibacter purpureus]